MPSPPGRRGCLDAVRVWFSLGVPRIVTSPVQVWSALATGAKSCAAPSLPSCAGAQATGVGEGRDPGLNLVVRGHGVDDELAIGASEPS